jgi:dynein heavy chain
MLFSHRLRTFVNGKYLQTHTLSLGRDRAHVHTQGINFAGPEALDTMKKIFMFALVWSIGGNIVGIEGKEKFSEFIRDEFQIARFPNSGTVYDYVFDYESKEYVTFESRTPNFAYNKEMKFSDILVPTKDTYRYSYLLGTYVKVQRGVLFVGETGTGKSVIMTDALNSQSEALRLIPFTINFSAQTSSPRTQEMLELKFEKRRKGVLGAPINKILVCFVDDVNMPAREEYGAQPPIELLRLIVDKVEYYRSYGGVWDRKKLFWSDVVDTVLVAACGPPGGGRNVVTGRFFRMFSMLNLSPPSQSVLKVIFSSILDGHLNDFSPEVKGLCKATVDASIEVYEKISAEMLPTPAKSHYTFNLRDLSKVFQGILSLKVQHCPNVQIFSRLWVHENQRVFQDRLIDTTDKETFSRWLHELLKRKFAQDFDFEETFVKKPILFGDYLKMGVTGDDRMYEPITDNSR